MGRAELLSAAFSLVAFLVYSKSIGRSGKTGTVTCLYTNLWENHYIIYLYYFPWEFGWKSSNINLPWRTFSLAYFLALFQLFNVGWSGIAVTIGLVTCGMLCKEQGITVVGICLIYDLCVVNKVRLIVDTQSLHITSGSFPITPSPLLPSGNRDTLVDNKEFCVPGRMLTFILTP